MTLDGFNALLFVSSALELLADIKRTILHCLLLPHSPIRAFTQCHLNNKVNYDLAITLYYFLDNKTRKKIDRLKV